MANLSTWNWFQFSNTPRCSFLRLCFLVIVPGFWKGSFHHRPLPYWVRPKCVSCKQTALWLRTSALQVYTIGDRRGGWLCLPLINFDRCGGPVCQPNGRVGFPYYISVRTQHGFDGVSTEVKSHFSCVPVCTKLAELFHFVSSRLWEMFTEIWIRTPDSYRRFRK
jgi:hypothetical protein